ncbi:MAG: hypothetical protein AAGG09_03280 [Pseudomonadota bacterium]
MVVATREEERAGHLWHGVLHCSNRACWMEFPVIDGVPLLVPDPAELLKTQATNALYRTDLPPVVSSIVGDATGPGENFDTQRYHLSLYGTAHFADWGLGGESGIASLMEWGLDRLKAASVPTGAPCLDLGGSVGRGGWELSARCGQPSIVADLNLSMLRFGQSLALEGEASLAVRRVGLVYDDVPIRVPDGFADTAPEFWAVDAAALPFAMGAFGVCAGINLVDCTAAPANVITELSRVTAMGGGAVVVTPHDWSPQATGFGQWLGGHSQRGPWAGAPEPVLRATLESAGLAPVAEEMDLPWVLRLHARARMTYSTHALACRRADTAAAA